MMKKRSLVMAIFVCSMFFSFSGTMGENNIEKYKRSVMFTISRTEMNKMRSAAGEEIAYFDETDQERMRKNISIDSDENIYFRFYGKIVVFNKKGKKIRSIDKKKPINDSMVVDEDGNVYLISNEKEHVIRIYNVNGKLEKTLRSKKRFKSLGFSRGVVFSKTTGEVYCSVLGNKGITKLGSNREKYISKNALGYRIVNEIKGEKYYAPETIEGFYSPDILAIDDKGNFYLSYLQEIRQENGKTLPERNRMYKFNPRFQMLTYFDFCSDIINGETQSIYNLEVHFDTFKVVKWENGN
jgi:hypothetical protein